MNDYNNENSAGTNTNNSSKACKNSNNLISHNVIVLIIPPVFISTFPFIRAVCLDFAICESFFRDKTNCLSKLRSDIAPLLIFFVHSFSVFI